MADREDLVLFDNRSLLVATQTVIGSNVTDVTFSGLDGNVNNGYVLEMNLNIIQTGGTASGMKMYFNGDFTDGNYYSWTQIGGSVGPVANPEIYPTVIASSVDDHLYANFYFGRNALTNMIFVKGHGSLRHLPDGIDFYDTSLLSTVANSNLISFTIRSSTINSIGIGSEFKLYRRA